ncbi:MAG: aminotransferase class V-fold PLP-dependent enzyme [Desulfuromonadaceae bacterium]|nr:aminotransferase class V-fold PLP-dependent enzyme [Desulfuromonadaceae bacterium]
MSIYLDNAATSFPKPESVYTQQDYIARNFGANPGRGSYGIARIAAQTMAATREAIADFFNISSSSRIAFTLNATQGINTALSGLLEPGHRVVTTSMEHNAVVRPLHYLQHHGVEVFKVTADSQGLVTPESIFSACSGATTKLVIMTHCSNVTGTVQPIAEVGRFCHEHDIIFMLDAAQSAGVLPIDVDAMHIDILVAPGHKGLLGPQGTGFIYVRDGLAIKPLTRGGTGNLSSEAQQPSKMPELLESGTYNTAALAGLKAGLEYILQRGMDNIRAHEQGLLLLLWDGLGAIPGVRRYGPEPGPKHSGLVSFTLDNHTTAEIGFILDQHFNIGVRTGLHCAPDAHRTIGTFPDGTVRVSPGCFNTEQHIHTLIQAIKSITS